MSKNANEFVNYYSPRSPKGMRLARRVVSQVHSRTYVNQLADEACADFTNIISSDLVMGSLGVAREGGSSYYGMKSATIFLNCGEDNEVVYQLLFFNQNFISGQTNSEPNWQLIDMTSRWRRGDETTQRVDLSMLLKVCSEVNVPVFDKEGFAGTLAILSDDEGNRKIVANPRTPDEFSGESISKETPFSGLEGYCRVHDALIEELRKPK